MSETMPVYVRDVMERSVVTVLPELTLRELIAVLSRHRISGAPVLDDDGRILGVISVRDVVDFLVHELEIPWGEIGWASTVDPDPDDTDAAFFSGGMEETVIAPPGHDARLDQHAVREIMTPAAFSVAPGDEIADAATFMVRGRIHRALVVEGETLVGIVTPLDLLRAVARSGERAVALS